MHGGGNYLRVERHPTRALHEMLAQTMPKPATPQEPAPEPTPAARAKTKRRRARNVRLPDGGHECAPLHDGNTDFTVAGEFTNVRVARDGRVQRFHPYAGWIALAPFRHKSGVLAVNFQQLNGRRRSIAVARLVALAFLPNPQGLKFIRHLDEDRANCNSSNLAWVGLSRRLPLAEVQDDTEFAVVPGFPRHRVSRDGRVQIHVEHQGWCLQRIGKNCEGYPQASIYDGTKRRRVVAIRRLVAQAFPDG
jgi:hypothetical protein